MEWNELRAFLAVALYLAAAKSLLKSGQITKDEVPWDTDGYKPASAEFIDGVEYDGRRPLEYLMKHKIGHQE